MTRNSTGLADEMDFIYPIPISNETKPVKIQDFLYFDPTFMTFDYEKQHVIFK